MRVYRCVCVRCIYRCYSLTMLLLTLNANRLIRIDGAFSFHIRFQFVRFNSICSWLNLTNFISFKWIHGVAPWQQKSSRQNENIYAVHFITDRWTSIKHTRTPPSRLCLVIYLFCFFANFKSRNRNKFLPLNLIWPLRKQQMLSQFRIRVVSLMDKIKVDRCMNGYDKIVLVGKSTFPISVGYFLFQSLSFFFAFLFHHVWSCWF